MRIVIVGGGWAGCAAAVCARKFGTEVVLLERTDTLLGTGLVGGIMRNNGRFTATEECIAMGGGELFQIADRNLRHANIDFPGHNHASLYDIASTPADVARHIQAAGIHVAYKSRVTKVHMNERTIRHVQTDNGDSYKADVFIDATGTAGPISNCTKYGNGCAMCILRCPSFGGRVSLAGLAGVKEMHGTKADGSPGAMSGACKLLKESLSPELVDKLNKTGVAVVPIPEDLLEDHISFKACQQYALTEYQENLILLDTGHAKMMLPFFDREKLTKIPGFENARYEDPYAGGIGNSMRFFDMAPRNDALQVESITNLFCCGEKAGPLVGHTEAIVTGTLAGYNATRFIMGKPMLFLPRSLAIGEAVSFTREQMCTAEGLTQKYTFSGSVFFDRMRQMGLYNTDISAIRHKISAAGLTGIFSENAR